MTIKLKQRQWSLNSTHIQTCYANRKHRNLNCVTDDKLTCLLVNSGDDFIPYLLRIAFCGLDGLLGDVGSTLLRFICSGIVSAWSKMCEIRGWAELTLVWRLALRVRRRLDWTPVIIKSGTWIGKPQQQNKFRVRQSFILSRQMFLYTFSLISVCAPVF